MRQVDLIEAIYNKVLGSKFFYNTITINNTVLPMMRAGALMQLQSEEFFQKFMEEQFANEDIVQGLKKPGVKTH